MPGHPVKSTAGFTLIELLIVIAIVGIISTLFYWALTPMYRRGQLADAQSMLKVQVMAARSASWRGGKSQTLTWTANTLTITPSAGPASVVNLGNGATITTPAPAVPPVYLAPFADLRTTDGGRVRLELVDGTGQYHTALDLIGATGKAVARPIVAASAVIP